jgi:signal transduction histidine kinase/CheY-like chemotaxis protein
LSELTVPITFEGHVIGVLDSESSRLDGFSESDEALATAVANIAAPRIASALAAEERQRAEWALVNAEEEYVQREEELRAERIESLGVLAGGIAHDFNNLLTAILGNLCLAQLDPTAEQNGGLLAEAEHACERASKLTQQLLTFSKGGTPVKESADLGVLLRESVQFALRGFNVGLELDLAPDLETVALDRDQMSHVFHNLVLNAAQAMGGVGQLRIEARRRSSGGGAVVSIADEGPGVPEGLRGRIFEPYFTTRDEGNGLGLASAHSIVRRHGGRLLLDADSGGGACFSVHLPAAPCERRPGGDADDQPPPPLAHILVLDDDHSARTAIVRMLESFGHRVVSVEEGGQCISAYEEARAGLDPFDLLFLDLAIPGGMGGREVIRRLRAMDQDVRAIVVSGYSEDPILSDPQHYGFMGRLRKPFRLNDLERELGRVLRGVPGS